MKKVAIFTQKAEFPTAETKDGVVGSGFLALQPADKVSTSLHRKPSGFRLNAFPTPPQNGASKEPA